MATSSRPFLVCGVNLDPRACSLYLQVCTLELAQPPQPHPPSLGFNSRASACFLLVTASCLGPGAPSLVPTLTSGQGRNVTGLQRVERRGTWVLQLDGGSTDWRGRRVSGRKGAGCRKRRRGAEEWKPRERGSGRGAWAAPAPATRRLPAHPATPHPCHCAQTLEPTEPQPQTFRSSSTFLKLGPFEKAFCFISTNTLIWDIWQKAAVAPCMLAC